MEDKSKGTRQKGKLDLKTKQKKMREAERCLWRGKGEIYNNFKVFQGRLQSERTNKTYFTSQQKKIKKFKDDKQLSSGAPYQTTSLRIENNTSKWKENRYSLCKDAETFMTFQTENFLSSSVSFPYSRDTCLVSTHHDFLVNMDSFSLCFFLWSMKKIYSRMMKMIICIRKDQLDIEKVAHLQELLTFITTDWRMKADYNQKVKYANKNFLSEPSTLKM